ncbi:MAG: hypothetical protein IJ351_02790 [Oscillospiraceae bacterium]|nr:hypothetical protein [Oscillospiraceae bacterium]
MKKLTTGCLITVLIISLLAGCSRQLTTTGCRVIQDEDNYVTYQQVCDNCGYEYGDPTTVYVGRTKLVYSLNCTQCGEIIYIRLERN